MLGLILFGVIACGFTSNLRADLLSHWTFDGDTDDSGPGGNDGTYVGLGPIYVDGYDGTVEGALSFNNIDEYVLVAQNSGLPLYNSPEFSIAMWVKGDGLLQVDERIWSESSSTNNSALFNLGTSNNGQTQEFDLFVRDAAGAISANHPKSTQTPFDDTWHHVAWVDVGGTAQLYVDGALDGTTFNYGRPDLTAGDPAVALDITTIGGILRADPCCIFLGAIDDVRIYDHALTPAEVLEISGFGDECPEEGDTHCTGPIDVEGPDGDVEGTYILTVNSASDDGGDTELLYSFAADNGAGTVLNAGPQAENSASFVLTAGTWTLSASVDDDPVCLDEAGDAACADQVVEVTTAAPELVGHWPLDGSLEDISGNGNDGVAVSGLEPFYEEGQIDDAAVFNGLDDLVRIEPPTQGLPLYNNSAFSIAMWVNGGPQTDFRVWSEASTTSNVPLFNIGTEFSGNTGQVDIYIRGPNGTVYPGNGHHLSQREAFDNTWHHIAWVDDGGNAVLYIDGTPDATDYTYVRPELDLDTTTIGGILRANPSHWFNGMIDDVRAYNYALTPEEVEELVADGITCPAEGDTHCDDIQVDTPLDGNIPGTYTLTALDALDDSGDSILYSWTFTDGDVEFSVGPLSTNVVQVPLSGGTWTATVTVDDTLLCEDVADDASCSREIVVESIAGDFLSHWRFDGDTLDSQPAENHGNYQGVVGPTFVAGVDGDALQLDGIDNLVQVDQIEDLPLYANPAFSIAMWVRGLPQPDFRIWSEASALNRTPLYNLGTENTGNTGQLDFFVRGDDNAVAVPHAHSEGIVFDGEWHHVAWVDDGGRVTCYIDGAPDATDFSYNRPLMTLDTTSIGGIVRDTPSHWFNGDIDDVRVYTYAISAAEVAEIIGGEPPTTVFRRGDVDGVDVINLTDGVFLLNFLFLGGGAPPCADAADANDDGALNITTGVYIFNWLFLGGPLPPAPGPGACGPDTTADELDCANYDNCP